MKAKHPDDAVTLKLAPWEVERLIQAAREVEEVYSHESAISGNTLLVLIDLKEALTT
jgi:hypothetical protein